MSGSARPIVVCSLGLFVAGLAGCTAPDATPADTDKPPDLPKPDVVYSGSYGHVPLRVAVDVSAIAQTDAAASSVAAGALTAAASDSCSSGMMNDDVAPAVTQIRNFQHFLFLSLPVLARLPSAKRPMSTAGSSSRRAPSPWSCRRSSSTPSSPGGTVHSRPRTCRSSAWFSSPAFCYARESGEELPNVVYVARGGAAGVESCADPSAFPEYFRWNDEKTRFAARSAVVWSDSWYPTLADLFGPPRGSDAIYVYDALTDTQHLVDPPSAGVGWGHVSQARGCGPERCVELEVGIREMSAAGSLTDPFNGGIVPFDFNRYRYTVGKFDNRGSAFRAFYHDIESYCWTSTDHQLYEADREYGANSALFDAAGCVIAYCGSHFDAISSSDCQLEPAYVGVAVDTLPFFSDAILNQVMIDPVRLTFDVPAFPQADGDPWAAFIVVRAGGDPARAEDLLADGSTVSYGRPVSSFIAWGDPAAYSGAEVWRLTPVLTGDGRTSVSFERLTGTVSAVAPWGIAPA